ncbi:DNA-binding CsgD family transcriptional regulator [Hephaestia caeni]|uniref:DNA-binding CsgD family transcriptional regulator n=1 Tax=Hephaestia caeni TaxID=645617 RepID=A0A397PD60_9SPHN|nr:LuxR family transcriptional regulator [Hephaestia caeni]RIA46343.1 DNA-binding CsgD family transcriptional regulator [Hephaestia caeni]
MFAHKPAKEQDTGSAETSAFLLRPTAGHHPDILKTIKSCRTTSDLRDCLLAYARLLGFYGARYVHIGIVCTASSGTNSQQPIRFFTTSPHDTPDADDWLARDPCAVQARTAFAPFAYSTRTLTGIDPIQRIWLENERMRGVAAGIALPVQDSAHGPAYISMFGNDEAGSRNLVELYAPELAFTAAHFHAKAKQLVSVADWVPRLSKREIQCLRLAAVGKTIAQSGKDLGISERTVEYHLRNASDKLGAPSKLRAVVLALAQGLAEF